MAENAIWIAYAIFALLATYFIHSTILLGGVWIVVRLMRGSSHTLEAKLWRWAAVLGIFTTPLQLSIGWPQDWSVELRPTGVAARNQDVLPLPPVDDTTNDPARCKEQSVNPELVPPLGPFVAPNGSAADFDSGDEKPTKVASATETSEIAAYMSQQTQTAPGDPSSPTRESRRFERTVIAVILVDLTCGMFVVVGIFLLAIQSQGLHRRFRNACSINEGPIRRDLNRLIKRYARGRQVRLLSCDTCLGPVVCGIQTWTIVLPTDAEHRFARDELRALLTHELAHLVRGDLRWLLIGRILCTCLAFQPLNFLARLRWQQASEYLCDQWAVQRGVTNLSLARCLTRVAASKLGGAERSIVLAATGPRSLFVLRVERLMNQDAVDVWASTGRQKWFTLLASLAVIMFLTVAPQVGLPSSSGMAVASLTGRDAETAIASNESVVVADWMLLEEDFRRLDLDVIRAEKLAEQFPSESQVCRLSEEIQRHAQRLREHRRLISNSIQTELER